ncbi:hypothetical protein B0H19DRAFT_1124492 [Mycena capillaripes]|nr:hypothetical protein B0H19DRAFT_1124492 [Mycena capillaripes]
MSASLSTTVFPPELERYIFEICGRSRPVVIPKLMLVAWRVLEWIEPLLYHTIAVQYTAAIDDYPIFTWPVLLAAIRSKPASFFHYSVHNICILFNDELQANVETLLSVCTGVQNLSILRGIDGTTIDEMALITRLRLTHFYGTLNSVASRPPPTHPSFAYITHLGLKSWDATWPPDDLMLLNCDHLSFMPRLTHLSFDGSGYIQKSLHILETCKFLRVLVAFHVYSPPSDIGALSRDLRFVAMRNDNFLRDWQKGALTGVDYWARAEDFIAKRRSGEIDALEYMIPGDGSQHIA